MSNCTVSQEKRMFYSSLILFFVGVAQELPTRTFQELRQSLSILIQLVQFQTEWGVFGRLESRRMDKTKINLESSDRATPNVALGILRKVIQSCNLNDETLTKAREFERKLLGQ